MRIPTKISRHPKTTRTVTERQHVGPSLPTCPDQGGRPRKRRSRGTKKKEYLSDIPFYMPSRMACFSVFRVCRNKVIFYISFGHLIKSLCVMVMSLRYRKDRGNFLPIQKFLHVLQHKKRLHKQKKCFSTYL